MATSTVSGQADTLPRVALVTLAVALVGQTIWTVRLIAVAGASFAALWRPTLFSAAFLLVLATRGHARAVNVAGRLMIGLAFLLALWSRFQNFSGFVRYAGSVLSFVPSGAVFSLAVAATICEVTLCVAMFTGVKAQWASAASAVLLFMFATSMVISGLDQFEWAVYVLSAGAFVLATSPRQATRIGTS